MRQGHVSPTGELVRAVPGGLAVPDEDDFVDLLGFAYDSFHIFIQ